MSNNAKQLYLMLYQRNNMSIKNGWQDKNGSTFIFFTRKEVEELLNISHTTAVNAFKELKKFTLIKEKRQGLNKPNMIYVQKVDESLDNPRKYSNYTSRSTKVKHLEVVKLNANNNTEKKNTEKKTTTTGKILVVNLKKPEKQNKEIDILKSEIEQTIKSNIKTQAVKNMINKKGTEKIRYYLNNWDSFVETTKMHSKTGFFIDAVKKEYDIPVKNQIKKAVNKPAQAMNYTQRKYSDEFFDQFYENLRTDVIDEQDNKTSQDTSESDLNAHTDLFENEGDTFHIPDIETPLKTDLNESQVCCSDGRNMNKEI